MTGAPSLAVREAGGVTYLDASPAFGVPGVRAVFSTRLGGVSPPPFASLNLDAATGDEPDRVAENWRRLARAAGFPGERVVRGMQVHGTAVRVIGPTAAPPDAEGGRAAPRQPPPERAPAPPPIGACDALVTAEPGPVLAVLTADCVPIYIVGSGRRTAVAAVHAGWRGTLAGVAAAALAEVATLSGAGPEACVALLGPSIGPCCYRVGDRVARDFATAFGARAVRWEEDGPRVDLWEANRAALGAGGVPPERIHVSGLCTACRTDLFFSHRAEGGRTGRMAALAWLEPR